MQKIRVIIVDDELRARTLLKTIIEEKFNDLEIVDSCEDLPKAIKAIRKLKPDLIFLDIEMPGHSGLELLEFFSEDEVDFAIIFTTAYQQYAINAIKVTAFDYILKPISPEDLVVSVERFKRKHEQKHQKEEGLAISANKIAVPTNNGLKFIESNSIVYVKADNSYTEVYTEDGAMTIVSRTLKNFEDVLRQFPNFFRCNKSYIVNMAYVTSYIKSDGGYLILKDKINVPIAADKVNDFLELSSIVKR
jgi:two-component system, LytTR family, response regulator